MSIPFSARQKFRQRMQSIELADEILNFIEDLEQELSFFETSAQLNARDTANRARANHTGTQPISSIQGLQSELGLKLEISDLANYETTTQLNSRDTANRDRANHTGTQNISSVSGLQDELDSKQDALIGFNNALFYQESPGVISSVPNWALNDQGGLTQTPNLITDNSGFKSVNNWIIDLEHEVASPSDVFAIHLNRANFDVTSTGEPLGTTGTAVQFINNSALLSSDADIGAVQFVVNSADLGEVGGDPSSVNGIIVNSIFGTIRENITFNGGLQGYLFQLNFDSGVQVEAFTTIFGDFLSAPDVEFEFYTGLSLTPNLGGIKDNYNYTAINISPNISQFLGSASSVMVGIFGNLGEYGASGFYQGLAIGPTIDSVPNSTFINISPTLSAGTNSTGIDVNMNNVIADNVLAARFTGDVQVNGDLQFSGGLSIGQLNAFSTLEAEDFGVQPAGVHGLISQLVGLENETHANADMIGVNTASIIQMQDNCQLTSGAFGLGFASTVNPAVVITGSGSSIENIHSAVFALTFDVASTGGTVENAHGARVVFIPNGITTVDNSRGFVYDAPFGPVSGNAWGMWVNADVENWFKQSIKIGGSAGVSDKVTNSDTALEIEGGAVLLPRLTETERDALSPIDGMVVYNTTSETVQARAAGSWVDL